MNGASIVRHSHQVSQGCAKQQFNSTNVIRCDLMKVITLGMNYKKCSVIKTHIWIDKNDAGESYKMRINPLLKDKLIDLQNA